MEIEPYTRETEKPWGKEILFTQPDAKRVGKLLYISAGRRISLQFHTEKEETILLFQGEARIILGETKEEVQANQMQGPKGYTIMPGIIHRLEAITDCVFFEVSSPEEGITYRLEDDYSRTNEQFPMAH